MTTRFSEKLKVVSFMAILAVFYLHATFPEEVLATMTVPVMVRQCIADVFGHCAVPMFYAISGFLFFRGITQLPQVFGKIRKRIRTLLIPFVIAVLFFTGLFLVKEPARFAGQSFWQILYACCYDDHAMAYHLWFLRDLVIIVAFSPLLYLLRRYLSYGCLVLLVLLYWWSPYTLFLYGMIWFMAGSLVLDRLERLPRWCVWCLLGVFLCLVWFRLNVGYAWKYLNILEIASGITGLWCLYDSVVPKDFELKNVPWLNLACQFTFFLYLYHEPLLHLLMKAIPAALGHQTWSYTLSFLVSPLLFLPIGLAVGYGLRRLLPRLYGVITGGR